MIIRSVVGTMALYILSHLETLKVECQNYILNGSVLCTCLCKIPMQVLPQDVIKMLSSF